MPSIILQTIENIDADAAIILSMKHHDIEFTDEAGFTLELANGAYRIEYCTGETPNDSAALATMFKVNQVDCKLRDAEERYNRYDSGFTADDFMEVLVSGERIESHAAVIQAHRKAAIRRAKALLMRARESEIGVTIEYRSPGRYDSKHEIVVQDTATNESVAYFQRGNSNAISRAEGVQAGINAIAEAITLYIHPDDLSAYQKHVDNELRMRTRQAIAEPIAFVERAELDNDEG